jgi:uncharacterized protein (DUF2249 family)
VTVSQVGEREEQPAAAAVAGEDVEALLKVLVRALRRLGETGHPEDASRLAAQAWSAIRHRQPVAAERLNGTMHYLSRLPVPPEEPKENQMPAADIDLDVRNEIPARRHELILETYLGLGAGEGFILINDHDPKPLYYQFEAEHNGEFTWEYLEEGPETWRVRIGKVAA